MCWLFFQLVFVLAKEMVESSVGCSSSRPSCLVLVPLRSIIEERVKSNEFDLEVKGFFPPKSPTEILKLMPQRRHASETLEFSAGFAAFFGVREEFFRAAFMRLNLGLVHTMPDKFENATLGAKKEQKFSVHT